MCSILGILDIQATDTTPAEREQVAREMRQRALRLSARLRHRGPDWSGIYADQRVVLAHERLAIVDPKNGAQPLRDASGELVLAVNGEIYNHRELGQELSTAYDFQTASDCEVIMPLFREHGAGLLERLNGIFAFILYDRTTGEHFIARDPIGVIPLYMGRDERGRLHVASELKALMGTCPQIELFPPGHYLSSGMPAPVPYYHPSWRDHEATRGLPVDLPRLRDAFSAAVHRQLMSDVPYGVLLSGGLDSSLVAATAARFAAHRIEDDDRTQAWWPRLHTFAIGLADSPDLVAAQKVADAIDSEHHGLVYTVQEGIDALSDVIYHVESYDVTTVRASTPMFLLARIIRAMGIKMVLSGEGADEIFGGYLYFHKAPDARQFHEETVRKIDALHQFDCLRANKSMAAWGVEARVPFLDKEFMEVAMGFDAAHKMTGEGRMEKHVLRQAHEGLLPDEILWRQKEQFSDGVGYAWIDSLRAHAEREVSDQDLQAARHRFPDNTPTTKEAFHYRAIFDGHFPGACAARLVPGGPSIACSTPTAVAWDASFAGSADPSGRAVTAVHRDAYDTPPDS